MNLLSIAQAFATTGQASRVQRFGHGHINRTWLVTTDRGMRYVLQRINPQVFVDAVGVARNTAWVTAHLRDLKPRLVPAVITTRAGSVAVECAQGVFRMLEYIEGRAGRAPLTLPAAYAAGTAFGRFQAALADYDRCRHVVPIAGFHQMDRQYLRLDTVLPRAEPGRRARAADAVAQVLAERAFTARGSGGPEGMIHGDCKIDNLLFAPQAPPVGSEAPPVGSEAPPVGSEAPPVGSEAPPVGSEAPPVVIDLDTVMWGQRAWDFGDLVRSAAVPGAEDSPGLTLDLARYRALAEGFVAGLDTLYDAALMRALIDAPAYITLLLGLRFLVDYLDGDRYFRVTDDGHNLRRATAQLALFDSHQRARAAMATILRSLQ
jgi:hypothetical protein